ncbi:hypothetical protein BGW80DRAFT_1294615 [Lactifluus volemus]|nr:hypothetical protein BGW80DRAFT_1294615 [Lactifluus volemus]
MSLEVDELCPSNIRCDKELNVSVAENAQDLTPEIPVSQTTPSLEQLGGRLLLARFVLGPCKVAVATCLLLFDITLHLSPALVWGKAWENKNRFDVQFFERTKVTLDTGSYSKWKTTGSC